MGHNDFHFTESGKLAPGLVSRRELDGVVRELTDIETAEALHESLVEQIQTLKDKELPMLKGKGFIVVDPANPRFTGEEIEDFEDARTNGSNVSYASSAGCAIIYAPVLVMRPKRETADSQPSELLKQLGLPSGSTVGAIEAPKPTNKR